MGFRDEGGLPGAVERGWAPAPLVGLPARGRASRFLPALPRLWPRCAPLAARRSFPYAGPVPTSPGPPAPARGRFRPRAASLSPLAPPSALLNPDSTRDTRIREALERTPRGHFIASPDLRGLISGRSIPAEGAVRQLLERTPRITSTDAVLLVGCGSGYLAAVLSRLAGRVVVVEREAVISDIARSNFERLGLDNLEVRTGEGEAGAPEAGPYDLVLCTCPIQDMTRLVEQLRDDGSLVCLEGGATVAPRIVRHFRTREGMRREGLGTLNLGRASGDVLIDLGFVDHETLARARDEATRLGEPILTTVRRLLHLEDAEVYQALARHHELRFARADEVLRELDPRLFHRFSKTFLDNQRLIPVAETPETFRFATDNPDAQTAELESMHPGRVIEKVLVTPADFRRLWSNIDLTTRGSELLKWSESTPEETTARDLLDLPGAEANQYLVSVYEAILVDAVGSRASDIHLERYGERIRVRLRVDGELRDLEHYTLTPRDHAGLINVIKVRAEIDISERRLPQGGRTRVRIGEVDHDLRVQIQPSLHGEHAVIRILSQSGRALGMKELGMSPRVAGFYRRLLENPAGLVLVVGPTGSGKSTTLYAGLQELADEGTRKVITAEDPIEYSIDNIQQTRVRPDLGHGFAHAMRSFVRQDPDVILVGEIRDAETALEAVRASQTGHVVLSTLHCNDAVDAIQRLFDLGLHANSVAAELMAVLAQRLARRICDGCRRPATPDPVILRELFPDQVPPGFRSFEGAGCTRCAGRGVRGRVAVVEYMAVNDDIRMAISARPSVAELRWKALDNGLVTMRDSALDHVIEGTIPLSELPRLLPQERMAPEARGGFRP
jgi:type IV pilus assembly protein PilB